MSLERKEAKLQMVRWDKEQQLYNFHLHCCLDVRANVKRESICSFNLGLMSTLTRCSTYPAFYNSRNTNF